MASILLPLCNSSMIQGSKKQIACHSSLISDVGTWILKDPHARRNPKHRDCRKLSFRFSVFASPEDSTNSEETTPSWAKPDSDEPPPWAQGGKKENLSQSFEIPFFVYLLASAITAIAAIGSIFEYANQKPVFGVLSSDSIFYTPLLGFFAFTGFPTSAFLWFKSVQVANKEAEEQDRKDGYL